VKHLRTFGVDAVLVPVNSAALPPQIERQLFVQLAQGGFTGMVLPNSEYHILFAPGISLH
jgi:hypothetical protein